MINMYDWFVGFGSILEQRKLSQQEILARFIRSVRELNWLGFIKPTQRKSDHVLRLIWGGM